MKKRTMNELRQTKEYRLSDQGGEYTVPCKGAKPKHIESYKNEQGPSPGFIKVQEEAKDHYEDVQKDLDKAAAEGSTRHWPKEIIERDYIEEAKIEIVDKITKHFANELVIEMICEEMSSRHVFQSSNYLTEAGIVEFEEQFFEFYHEHHGEILYKVLKNITNG